MFLLCITITLPSVAMARDIGDYTLSSAAAIVIDFDTGIAIYEYNADEQRVPASMLKMVAVHVVLDAISDGIISLDTMVDISESTSEFSLDRVFSNVPLSYEYQYSVRELLDVVIVRSAGAATVALGEAIFGSEEAFVAQMNRKAEELGIQATFHDSWGGSPDNRISARGMAEMTRALIAEHPDVLYFTSQRSITFNDIDLNNTNQLLGNFEGADGFKTGFTTPAGWCFSGTAIRNERRVISVTMGSEREYRFTDSIALLNYGFNNYGAGFATYFRTAASPSHFYHPVNNALIPIQMFDVDMARYFGIRELAIILNEN